MDKRTEVEAPQSESNIYFIIFEDYLRPKASNKNCKVFDTKLASKTRATPQTPLKTLRVNAQNPERKTKNTYRDDRKQCKLFGLNFRLPKFFSSPFSPTTDLGVRKRRTDFETYCKITSIHGFHNFIGARLWQRLLWGLIIFLTLCGACIVISLALRTPINRNRIFYAEGITDSPWSIPLPAITICNLNRISKREANKVANKFMSNTSMPRNEILRLFRFSLYASLDVNGTAEDFQALEMLLKRNNYTITNLLRDISPKCGIDEFKLCKFKGYHERCQTYLEELNTPFGVCCSFNNFVYKSKNLRPLHTTSCSPETGFSLMMNPNSSDHLFPLHKFNGYEVYFHSPRNAYSRFTERHFIPSGTETYISISPRSSYGTYYLRRKNPKIRRCYFSDEHRLITFRHYSLTNCLAECRSRLMYEQCNCLPPFWPKLANYWTYCQSAAEINCSLSKSKNISSYMILEPKSKPTISRNQSIEVFICGCLPSCDYNQYTSKMESTQLNLYSPHAEKRLFRGIKKLGDSTLLHIFYEDLIAETFRLDVPESWLSTIGTIGGLAGLHMGLSFISIFELIFFIIVRPLCDWLTKRDLLDKKFKNQTEVKKAGLQKYKKQIKAQID